MRTLIVSDIHSNFEAFTSVLQDARARGGWDQVWSLGDLVGYGPDPGPCIDLARELGAQSIAGNHDWATAGRIPLNDFNVHAASAVRWTIDQISPDQHRFLSDLTTELRFGPFTLVHGSPRDPIWEYLVASEAARANFALLVTTHCLIGHSHIALAFQQAQAGERPVRHTLAAAETLELQAGRWIVNPGSVGQPRDGDPRAAYAIYDDATGGITAYRVSYDIVTVQRKMLAAGLPTPLAERLSIGR